MSSSSADKDKMKSMTLDEAIVHTRREMTKRHKMCQEALHGVKERVADLLSDFKKRNKINLQKDRKCNERRFDTSVVFDYGVDSWNYRNETEGIAKLKIYKKICPELENPITELGKTKPDLKGLLMEMLVDYRRMKVHDDLLQEEHIQPLEDVKMWMSGLDSDAVMGDEEAAVEQIYQRARTRCQGLKPLQDKIEGIANSYRVSCMQEVEKLKKAESIIREKKNHLASDVHLKDFKEDITIEDVYREGFQLLRRNAHVQAKIQDIKERITKADKAIAEIDGQYQFTLEAEVGKGDSLEEHKVTILTLVSKNLERMNDSLKAHLDNETIDVARMNALSNDMTVMDKVMKESNKYTDNTLSKSDIFKECQNDDMRQHMKTFISHLDMLCLQSEKTLKTKIQEISTVLARQQKLKFKPIDSLEVTVRIRNLTTMIADPRQRNKCGNALVGLGNTILNQFTHVLTSDKLRILEDARAENEYLSKIVEFIKTKQKLTERKKKNDVLKAAIRKHTKVSNNVEDNDSNVTHESKPSKETEKRQRKETATGQLEKQLKNKKSELLKKYSLSEKNQASGKNKRSDSAAEKDHSESIIHFDSEMNSESLTTNDKSGKYRVKDLNIPKQDTSNIVEQFESYKNDSSGQGLTKTLSATELQEKLFNELLKKKTDSQQIFQPLSMEDLTSTAKVMFSREKKLSGQTSPTNTVIFNKHVEVREVSERSSNSKFESHEHEQQLKTEKQNQDRRKSTYGSRRKSSNASSISKYLDTKQDQDRRKSLYTSSNSKYSKEIQNQDRRKSTYGSRRKSSDASSISKYSDAKQDQDSRKSSYGSSSSKYSKAKQNQDRRKSSYGSSSSKYSKEKQDQDSRKSSYGSSSSKYSKEKQDQDSPKSSYGSSSSKYSKEKQNQDRRKSTSGSSRQSSNASSSSKYSDVKQDKDSGKSSYGSSSSKYSKEKQNQDRRKSTSAPSHTKYLVEKESLDQDNAREPRLKIKFGKRFN